MVEEEDPQAFLKAEMARTAKVQAKTNESRKRAPWIRNLRVANHIDVLVARLLEGQ